LFACWFCLEVRAPVLLTTTTTIVTVSLRGTYYVLHIGHPAVGRRHRSFLLPRPEVLFGELAGTTADVVGIDGGTTAAVVVGPVGGAVVPIGRPDVVAAPVAPPAPASPSAAPETTPAAGGDGGQQNKSQEPLQPGPSGHGRVEELADGLHDGVPDLGRRHGGAGGVVGSRAFAKKISIRRQTISSL